MASYTATFQRAISVGNAYPGEWKRITIVYPHIRSNNRRCRSEVQSLATADELFKLARARKHICVIVNISCCLDTRVYNTILILHIFQHYIRTPLRDRNSRGCKMSADDIREDARVCYTQSRNTVYLQPMIHHSKVCAGRDTTCRSVVICALTFGSDEGIKVIVILARREVSR